MGTEVTSLASMRQVSYDTFVNFPTGAPVGDLAYATDRRVLYRWSGAAWDFLSQYHFYGVAGDKPAPSDLPDGSTYFETDTEILQQVQSGAWKLVTAVSVITAPSASDSLRNSNDAEKTTGATAYTKIKEVLLNADLPAVRIKFEFQRTTESAYARIYKNGVAIGTERYLSGAGWTSFSEDFMGFVSGDLIQIYAKVLAGGTAYIKNMRFCYDSSVITLGGESLATPLPTTVDPTISVTNQDP